MSVNHVTPGIFQDGIPVDEVEMPEDVEVPDEQLPVMNVLDGAQIACPLLKSIRGLGIS